MQDGEIKSAQACQWRGEFGGTYPYEVYELPIRAEEIGPRAGNYIYARRDRAGEWQPVYIGSGGFAACELSRHPQRKVIERGGATHFHFHAIGDELESDAEKDDILAAYSSVMSADGGTTPASEFQHPERVRAYSKLPPAKRGRGTTTGVGEVTPRHVEPSRPNRSWGSTTKG